MPEMPNKPTLYESFIAATKEPTIKDWCWIGADFTVVIYAFVIMLPFIKMCIPERKGIKTLEKKKTNKPRVLKKVKPGVSSSNWHVPHKKQVCRY